MRNEGSGMKDSAAAGNLRKLFLFFIFNSSLFVSVSGQAVVFSHPGGFYADTFSLSMHIDFAPQGAEGYAIHYTLDGGEPTECATRYEAPLPLSAACYSQSEAYKVKTVPDDRWFAPDSVERIIVVRAAAFDSNGYRCSPVTTHSYLIDSLLGRRISLPVVSVCADSLSLFDHDTGLFVPGWYHDPHYAYSTGNYFQKGRHWEREAAMGYYAPDGTALEQDCGLRAHGNSQRVLVQKGMSLYARNDYGERSFDYPFFGDRGRRSYRRLVLRPWSTSWSGAGVEDWLCQHLADSLRFDHLSTRPVVLFLNGEYWGIYFLEEKADEHYLEARHGVEADSVDLLAYWGSEVENGAAERWEHFYRWLEREGSDFGYIAAQVDTGAVMDYMLMQILILNDDWPVSNVRQWAAPQGRWRWIFFDADGALSSFPDNAAILDYMTYKASGTGSHTSHRSTLLFRRLFADRQFLERSMARLREVVDTRFSYSRSGALLRDIVAQVESEVPYQIRRFDKPSSMVKWRLSVSLIDDYLRTEPEAMVNEYAQYFGLEVPRDGSFAAYDRVGRQVLPAGSREVQMQALPKGVYFLRMDGGEIKKKEIKD